MNKFILLTSIVVASAGAFAAEKASVTNKPAVSRAKALQRMGGIVEKPGSMKGKAVIYNAQKTVAVSNLQAVAERLSRDMKMNFIVKDGTLDGIDGNWTVLRDREGAAALVVVAEVQNTPSLLVAPDEYWALVNVSKQDEGLDGSAAKTKFVPDRTTRQVFRAFALLGGAGRPQNQSPSTVRKLSELDYARDALPMDTMAQIAYVLEGRGMTKKQTATYQIACFQGWAAAPTNDCQKAIWDRVHAMPTSPIKIKPETKKVKE